MLRFEEIAIYRTRLGFEFFLIAGKVSELRLHGTDEIFVSLQARYFRARCLIKYAHSLVRAAAYDPASIELDTGDAFAMPRKGPYASTGPDIPHFDAPVT